MENMNDDDEEFMYYLNRTIAFEVAKAKLRKCDGIEESVIEKLRCWMKEMDEEVEKIFQVPQTQFICELNNPPADFLALTVEKKEHLLFMYGLKYLGEHQGNLRVCVMDRAKETFCETCERIIFGGDSEDEDSVPSLESIDSE